MLPHRPIKDKNIRLNQAQAGAQSGVLSINECRERLDAEGLDSDALMDVADEWGLYRRATGLGQSPYADLFQMTNVDADDLPSRPSEANATRVSRMTEKNLIDAYTILEKEVLALLPLDSPDKKEAAPS